jgi:hypothetical protein
MLNNRWKADSNGKGCSGGLEVANDLGNHDGDVGWVAACWRLVSDTVAD